MCNKSQHVTANVKVINVLCSWFIFREGGMSIMQISGSRVIYCNYGKHLNNTRLQKWTSLTLFPWYLSILFPLMPCFDDPSISLMPRFDDWLFCREFDLLILFIYNYHSTGVNLQAYSTQLHYPKVRY